MGQPQGLFTELTRWRDKASKRGKACTFTSDIIPDWLNAEIVAAMETVGHVKAFSFLKQAEPGRMAAEREIEPQVLEVLEDFQSTAERAVRAGEQPDYESLAAALMALFVPFFTEVATEQALRVSAEVGIQFDPAVINQQALAWAQSYSFELVTGLTNTTRRQVSQAIASFIATPGMTQGDITKLLAPTFGQVRADMIAVTEVTRAYSEATNEIQRMINQAGLEMMRIWHTARDDRVCFPAWAMVDTAQGPRPIQHIKPGEWVCTREGHRQVVAVNERVYSGRMIQVETDNLSITATIDHPFWTLEKGWLEGRHVEVGHTLQVGKDHTAKVRSVVNFALGDAADRPVSLLEIPGLARIAGLILMPVFAVNLQGNAGVRYKEVNRIAPHSGLLDVLNAKSIKGFTDPLFKERFTLIGTIASKATELPVSIAGLCSELFAAISAFDVHGWASALLRAVARFPSRLVGLKRLTTSFAGVHPDPMGAAFPTTVIEPLRDTGVNLEGAPASRADFRNLNSTPRGIIARAATKAATLRDLALVQVGFFATYRAGNQLSASFSRHIAHLLTSISLLYHRLSGAQIKVFNLQVEGAQEFYANGILVHNCPICGPLDGLPESEWRSQFPKGPPAHPDCRCGAGLSAAGDKFHIKEGIDLARERIQMLDEMGEAANAEAARQQLKELRERI